MITLPVWLLVSFLIGAAIAGALIVLVATDEKKWRSNAEYEDDDSDDGWG